MQYGSYAPLLHIPRWDMGQTKKKIKVHVPVSDFVSIILRSCYDLMFVQVFILSSLWFESQIEKGVGPS